MKILFILKQEPDANIKAIITESRKDAETIVIDLREEHDYDALVENIETYDKVITW